MEVKSGEGAILVPENLKISYRSKGIGVRKVINTCTHLLEAKSTVRALQPSAVPSLPGGKMDWRKTVI